MTAQTSISRSSRKMNYANTAKAKNTDQIRLSPWDYLWIGWNSSVFRYFPKTRIADHFKTVRAKDHPEFNCSEFIFCSDSGLGSHNNRRFNSFNHRAYVITHSLKKMKAEERKEAMNPTQFRKIGAQKFIDLRTLDETDEEIYNSVYYKEYPLITGDMDETLIVTYSPKYAAYQRKLRECQIERAQKILISPGKKRKGTNQNDPMRFVKRTTVTKDGEIAEKTVYGLDQEQIEKEAMYDGFYAVVTNLEGDVGDIIRINQQRWEIEENFRIMKDELGSRPAFVRREDRIKAHFMTCYISLIILSALREKDWEQIHL